MNTEKNVFNCFTGCGGGNILDLVPKVEDSDVRVAGEKLASWFGLGFKRSDVSGNGPLGRQEGRSKGQSPSIS